MLIASFNKIDEINQMNAQNAGLIDASKFCLCKYSHIKAQANGHKIRPNGQKNIHIIIHVIHHRFPRLVHQNFLVQIMGRK